MGRSDRGRVGPNCKEIFMTPEFMKRYPDYPEMSKELALQIEKHRGKVAEWKKKHPETTVTESFESNGTKYLSKRTYDDAGRLVSSSLSDLGLTPLKGWTIQFYSKERIEIVRFEDYDELREFVANNSPK